jgi:hypothetical protein
MVPRTFPSTYQTANGETRMVVFFLSSVSGLRKWVDYIPVKFTMLETQVNNSYNNNGVILVDPLSSTTNRQAWVDYVPVFVDANDTVAWRVDANGFIPVGFSTKPTLNLDFAGTKTLDSRVTFSRGSNATLFDSSGNLVYAKHNLLTYSEQFDIASWTKNNASITANTIVAPNGTLTGDKLVEDATNNQHDLFQVVSGLSTGATYTYSFYAKAAERSRVQIYFSQGGNNAGAIADLSAETIGSVTIIGGNWTGGSATIINVGNGWYRLSLTVTIVGSSALSCRIVLVNSSNNTTYTGNGVDGIYIWGAQFNATPMEGGVTSSLSTYYPTVASAYYAPRFDHNPTTLESLGLLIEEQRTNSIRNNTMQGAVAGTPGTLPTNWAIGAIGLSSTIVGTGTENGITYVDIRVFGTTTSQFGSILFETTTGIVASASQSWTNSIYLKLVAGTVNGLSQVGVGTYYYNSTPTFLTNSTAQVTLTSTLTRYTLTATTPATTAYIRPLFYFNGANASGDAVDFTLRIGLPQLEQGAFATSVIPTTVAAATRNADVATMTDTNFSSWYNQSEGTVVCIAQRYALIPSTAFANLWAISDNTVNERYLVYNTGAGQTIDAVITDGGTPQATLLPPGAIIANTPINTALAYKVNDFAMVRNSGTVATDTNGTLPTVDRLYIGANHLGGGQWTGYIQRIAYYPVRLSNDQLQALTR